MKPEDVKAVMDKADLVVSRSGMNTITELLAFKKPAILIPLPYAQNNEQYKNAIFFTSHNVGKVLDQESLTPDIFFQEIDMFIENLSKHDKTRRISTVIIKDAPERIIDLIRSIIDEKKKK